MVGSSCYQVLGGHSDGGCVVCRRGCLPFSAGRRGEQVSSFDVQVRTTEGHPRWVNVSILPIPVENGQEPAAMTIVHLFRDVEGKKQAEAFAREVASRARQLMLPTREGESTDDAMALAAPLTTREQQVLALLAKGMDTEDIATQLVIHKATVRNHIEHILHKLGVHSRLEAVTYAQEHHLLETTA